MLTRRALLASATAALALPPRDRSLGAGNLARRQGHQGHRALRSRQRYRHDRPRYADQMAKVLNTTIVIENRAGANGLLGADAVAKSRPTA